MKNIIKLGSINLNWHFAKCEFLCDFTITENLSAFERIVCGILNRNDDEMSEIELASLLGLNAIDDPDSGRFRDEAEWSIFQHYTKKMENIYNLIKNDDSILVLTENGKKSLESKEKKRHKQQKETLYLDEFSDCKNSKALFDTLAKQQIDFDDSSKWNPDNASTISPIICSRVDANWALNSYEKNTPIEYYVASIPFDVFYNFETYEVFVESTNKHINKILQEDKSIYNQLLDLFFKSQHKSVILKQPYQTEAEEKCQSSTSETPFNILNESYFFEQLPSIVKAQNIIFLYFSFLELTSDIKQKLLTVPNIYILAEFVSGDYEEGCQTEGNIIFRKVDNPRILDFCVADSVFFKKEMYVVNYNNSSYMLPMLFMCDSQKYILKSLLEPFAEPIVDLSILKCKTSLNQNDASNKEFLKLLKKVRTDRALAFWLESPECKTQEFDKILNSGFEKWKDGFVKKLEDYIVFNRSIDKETFSQFCKDADIVYGALSKEKDKDIQECLNKLGRRLVVPTPKKKQKVYILDTNVFIDQPKILKEVFDSSQNKVRIPRAVEQELDGLTHRDETSENARTALVSLRQYAVERPQFFRIEDDLKLDLLPIGFDRDKKDNHLLALAIELAGKQEHNRIVIVSQDINFKSNVEDLVQKTLISDKIITQDLKSLMQ